MGYASVEELAGRLDPELLLVLADDNADGVADTAMLSAALDDASAEMDLFLGVRYATPVANAPAVLRRMSVDIAIHLLFARKRLTVSPESAARYANCIKALGEVAAGRLTLPNTPVRMRCASTRTSQSRVFEKETTQEF